MKTHRADPAPADGTEPRDRASPSRSEVLSLLANARRRRALERLRDLDSPIALADLANEVAVAEHGTIISEIPPEEVKLVYLSLYHSHIPKLAEADVVEYRQESDLDEPWDGFTYLAPYLDLEEGE